MSLHHTPVDLLALSQSLPRAWASTVVDRPAGVNLKVLRMSEDAYPAEVHDFAEALLVLEGCMRLDVDGCIIEVHAGQVLTVPPGVPHAVAPGSHGSLVIIDPLSPTCF